VTGWLLVISILILGGILSTLGDRIGSKLGKARLTLFNLRPRKTAVLITIFTGSLISALSLGFMLLVSRQLRLGLFELSNLQDKIKAAESELVQRENNLIAFRRGDVVLRSGQSLSTATIELDNPTDEKTLNIIDRLLQEANLEAFRKVLPGNRPNRRILLVPREDINKLQKIIKNKGSWVVNIRSAANVLLGESAVYAFPEVRPNITLVRKGEILARTFLEAKEDNSDSVKKRIRLLLASTLAEVKRRGSLTNKLEFDPNALNELGRSLVNRLPGKVELQSIALKDSDTADILSIYIKVILDPKMNKP